MSQRVIVSPRVLECCFTGDDVSVLLSQEPILDSRTGAKVRLTSITPTKACLFVHGYAPNKEDSKRTVARLLAAQRMCKGPRYPHSVTAEFRRLR